MKPLTKLHCQRVILLIVSALFLIPNNCIADTKLSNPDGLFHVQEDGIMEIDVFERDEKGDYSLVMYVVANKNHNLYPGRLVFGGWWYPSSQQFYLHNYSDFGEGNKRICNSWNKNGSWTNSFTVSNNLSIGGKTYSGFKLTRNAPPERKPEERVCLIVSADENCNITCAKWGYPKGSKNGVYLVKSKKDAFKIYNAIRH